MIRLVGSLPERLYVAVSGGADSMAVLDFLTRTKRDIRVVHVNHGTEHAKEASAMLEEHCWNKGYNLKTFELERERDPKESMEEYWRNERYRIFSELNGPVITCHHLDDVIEWYLFSAIHGEAKIIPYERGNVIRPFLLTPRQILRRWCERKNVPFVEDPGNRDERYMRSIIRHEILPQALRVNPGLHKVVFKLVKQKYALV